MKKTFFLLLAFMAFCGLQVNGQWSVTNVATDFIIDFDNTVAGINQGAFAGTGFATTPSDGQLNTDAWAAFAGAKTKNFSEETSDIVFGQGSSTGGVTAGGIHAFEVETDNVAFGIQPSSSVFNTGYIALKIQNNTGADVNSVDFSYDVWELNDHNISTNFNGEYSLDGATWISIPEALYSTELDLDPTAVWIKTPIAISLSVDIPNGDFFYFRWNMSDNSGVGLRDEFAFDNVTVNMTTTTALLSDENDILTFVLAEETGAAIIDNTAKTVTIEVALGTDLATLTPTITISDNATIIPDSGVEVDFTTSPVVYTVTSESGVDQVWNVTVTVESGLSNEKNILTFAISGQIGSSIIGTNTIDVEIGWQSNVAGLTPTITISQNATVNPVSGQTQNFTNPLTYTVTAENGTTKDYIVSVTQEGTPLGANCANPYLVEIPTDLPYNHISTTCGLGSVYNLPSTNYDNGDDAIYRLDITGGAVVKITMSPELSQTGLFLFDACPNVGTLINSVTNTATTDRVITAALPAGTYYVMLDKWPMPKCFPYELTIEEICPVPTAIQAANLSATSSEIHWTAGGYETSWNIKVNQGVAINPLLVEGSLVPNALVSGTPEFTIPTALTALTTYYVYVQAGCGSDWVEYVFATPSSCPIPTGLTSIVTGANTATIAWTELGMSSWLIKVSSTSLTNPDSQIADIENNTPVAGAVGEFNLTGLAANTSYYWRVKSACGSSWSAEKIFKTNCGTESLPYLQNFESAVVPGFPECTSVQNVGTGNMWKTSSNPGYGFTTKVLHYNYSSNGPANTWFYTQPVELVAGISYRLNFKYGSNSTSYAEKLKVSYGTSAVNTAMTNLIVNYSAISNSTPNVSETDFTPTVSGTYYLGFNCYSGTNQYYLYVDDILLDITPTCLKPVNLNVDSITATSAKLLWTQTGTPGSWNVKVSTQSINPSLVDGDIIANQSTTNNSFIVTGLESGTRYYFYVQANCGLGDLSYWSNEGTLFTQCDAYSVPFTEKFDDWGTGSAAFPYCWKRPVSYISGTAIYPSCVSAYSVSSPNSLRFQSLTTEPTYAVTPAIANDIHNLMVTFSLKAENTTSSGVFEIGVMSNANNVATFELVQTITPTSTSWTSYEVMLNATALTGSNKHIAFRHTSNSNIYYYWLDDVAIDLLPACPKPTTLFADNITETSATLNWTENGSATSWNFKASTSPINPSVDDGDIEMIFTSNPFTLPVGTLNSSSTYYYYIQADCGSGDVSYWTEGTLTTDCEVVSIFPWTEGFENGYVNQTKVGGCWSQESITGLGFWTANSTLTDYNRTPRTGNYNAYLKYSNNDWMYYAFDLTAGVSYKVDLYARQDATSGANLKVSCGANANAVSMTNPIIAQTAVVNGDYQLLTGTFTPTSSGIYYIGIYGELTSVPWYLSIDDFTISEILPVIAQIDINSDVTDVSVCKGVSETAAIAALASQITITDSGTNQHVVNLTWTIDAYVGTTVGVYNATGVFELPAGVGQTTPATPLEVTATVTVTDDLAPTVSCPNNFTVTEPGIVALSGGLPAGGTYSGQGVTSNNFNPSSLEDDVYTISYTYTDPVSGCSNSCEFTITVDLVISINENEIAKIGVYPNPNNGKFNISFNNINGKVVYQIYDTKGSVIAAKNIYTDGNTIEEVSLNLIPGVYFVKVITTNQSYVEKLVIQ